MTDRRTSWVSLERDSFESAEGLDAAAPGSAARSTTRGVDDTLGTPLSIKQVATVVGCSPWTVRQVLIPRGLPCFRAGANGRLIFYRQQVVQWVLQQQQHRKGRP